MKPTINEKFIAFLALISGLAISVVAEYYSILGLTAIFAAAVIPVVIMGIALGIGKISATLWLKQNWELSPWPIRIYLGVAIMILMLITSMGIFGFLSKAHSEQSLVSGDVLAKISVYDEKIKVSKENIDVNRKALKQMDEAVDQVMGRSSDEKGADKAVAIRRNQQKERTRLLAEIETEQKKVTALNEERAPIAAEVRKVEAEVGPIKYIASFIYGDTEQAVLEKAVTWVIIILIAVFDPLAVILLLASQYSFAQFRKSNQQKEGDLIQDNEGTIVGVVPSPAPIKEELEEGDSPLGTESVIDVQDPTVTELAKPSKSIRTIISRSRKNLPEVKVFKSPTTMTSITEEVVQQKLEEPTLPKPEEKQFSSGDYVTVNGQTYRRGAVPPKVETTVDSTLYVQNEEQGQSGLWSKTKPTDKE
jgi:hypothetical protein